MTKAKVGGGARGASEPRSSNRLDRGPKRRGAQHRGGTAKDEPNAEPPAPPRSWKQVAEEHVGHDYHGPSAALGRSYHEARSGNGPDFYWALDAAKGVIDRELQERRPDLYLAVSSGAAFAPSELHGDHDLVQVPWWVLTSLAGGYFAIHGARSAELAGKQPKGHVAGTAAR